MSDTSPKQVIVMRKDLNMRKGKMVAHASMKVLLDMFVVAEGVGYGGMHIYKMCLDSNEDIFKWLVHKFTKICVGVDSEQQLLEIYNKAVEANLPAALITDSGTTEFGVSQRSPVVRSVQEHQLRLISSQEH
jgi:PTH2 family peptidyl-tRNA hydrolase